MRWTRGRDVDGGSARDLRAVAHEICWCAQLTGLLPAAHSPDPRARFSSDGLFKTGKRRRARERDQAVDAGLERAPSDGPRDRVEAPADGEAERGCPQARVCSTVWR